MSASTPAQLPPSADCLIIGAGAAGLMCAATAASKGARVVLLEHANKPGKKILMSGGGRCNFTNLVTEPRHYLCPNPHFTKSALRRYTPQNFISMVEAHGIAYHEKTLGQLFCDNKSSDILNLLLDQCDQAGVQLVTHCSVEHIHSLPNEAEYCFRLATTRGEIKARDLVIASGGLSIPTMGATGFGYQIAEQFGHQVTERSAALVPFTLQPALLDQTAPLSGVSLPAEVSCNNKAFSEGVLFTHRGISGPAILQISSHWKPGDKVRVNFLPGVELSSWLKEARQRGGKASLKNTLNQLLPRRFVDTWLELAKCPADSRLADIPNKTIDTLADLFQRWTFTPSGTEGYRTAEVTRGGVCVDEVSSKTFESKLQPGLYFIGEVLDVTGWLGGYNFQWAWASGYCAGEAIAARNERSDLQKA